nr:hypothetical protein [uncultured Kingella sp.]
MILWFSGCLWSGVERQPEKLKSITPDFSREYLLTAADVVAEYEPIKHELT